MARRGGICCGTTAASPYPSTAPACSAEPAGRAAAGSSVRSWRGGAISGAASNRRIPLGSRRADHSEGRVGRPCADASAHLAAANLRTSLLARFEDVVPPLAKVLARLGPRVQGLRDLARRLIGVVGRLVGRAAPSRQSRGEKVAEPSCARPRPGSTVLSWPSAPHGAVGKRRSRGTRLRCRAAPGGDATSGDDFLASSSSAPVGTRSSATRLALIANAAVQQLAR